MEITARFTHIDCSRPVYNMSNITRAEVPYGCICHGCGSAVGKHNGPHLRNERTTENWAYGRFYAKLGIYQYGRERWLRSNLTSGLSSCTQGLI